MHQCIKFILFCNDTLYVSDGLSVHHQQFKTVHTATGSCQTDTAECCKHLSDRYCICLTNACNSQQYLFDKSLLLYVQS